MEEPTIETVRAWIIEAQVGLIDKSQLVARIDDAILQTTRPPEALVALSLQEDTSWTGRLDLVLHPATDDDSARLARQLLTLLAGSQITWDQLEAIAFRAALLVPDSEDSHCQFMAVADGLHIARECGAPWDQATQEAKSRLERIASPSSV